MQPAKQDSPEFARSVAADRTPQIAAPVHIPNAIEPLGPKDIFGVADAEGEVTGELPCAVDVSPEISTPHSRDVEFITSQMARLPRPADR